MLGTLKYYWRTNLAVLLAVAVAAAVLCGALAVGDSVRGSLRDLTLDRLGKIDHVLAGTTFFSESIAGDPTFTEHATATAPLIVLRGSVVDGKSGTRATDVAIYGVDERFLGFFEGSSPIDFTKPEGQFFPAASINESLARELAVEPGASLVLQFASVTDLPRDTLMGESGVENLLQSTRVGLTAVLPDRGVGRFGLVPAQQVPLNLYVSLEELQRLLGREDRVNALVVEGDAVPAAPFRKAATLEDMGLSLIEGDGFVTIESASFVLSPEVERALSGACGARGLSCLPVQSYLANEIAAGENSVPYSLVAALDPLQQSAWDRIPLAAGSAEFPLGQDEIVVGEWLADDLDVAPGDVVTLTYFVVGPREELTEDRREFRIVAVNAMADLGVDRDLTPDYPGIQDAEDIAAWDPPFPVDLGKIRAADEQYWDDYASAPKAFVSQATGRELWSTRYGDATSMRIGIPSGHHPQAALSELRNAIRERLGPADVGMTWRELKAEGLEAASGATDFSMLFVAFSQFLIVSAAMLVGLLFRLGTERRVREIGLLLATGYPVAKVRNRLLAEGFLLALVGGGLGVLLGVGYAGALMHALRTIWKPAVGSSELTLHVVPLSLVVGFVAALVVVLLSIWLVLRRLVKLAPPRLLAGATGERRRRDSGRVSFVLAYGGLTVALVLLVYALVSGTDASPALSFGIGALLLVAGLAYFSRWCHGERGAALTSLARMAARNSSWNPGRSVLSVALVASACFLIVAVAANREDPANVSFERDGGTGGFSLVAESDIPVFQNLDTAEGRFDAGLDEGEETDWDGVAVVPFRLLPGDDASCLNLYKPKKPRVIGAPEAFTARNPFSFKAVLDPAEAENPWNLLEHELEEGVVPAVADAESAQWILKTKLGEEIEIEDERGRPLRLRLVGLLHGSILQSELIVSERNFLDRFPSHAGDRFFLIETPEDRVEAVATRLESGLTAFGFDVQQTRERLASYQVVKLTYISTFQVLGGLGLLLGTIGLGLVLVRNVLERRGELAALRAFGFERGRIVRLVLGESAFLLAAGVGIGAGAALLSVAPRLTHLVVPWGSLSLTIVAVFFTGMIASVGAVLGVLRVPLLPELKAER